MALSQVQCLDDNHVNWRLNESKPEFFYSEEQRLALEALITKGRDAFDAYVKEHELRPFLSEPELERLRRSIEDYKPGSEHQKPDGTTEGEETFSLQYWPDRSDTSIPNLDLGWPDCNSYRGVTRVHVYTQPPMDGQTHIKEVVRKAIAQAQKMIAVVMDVFTDVDIFKDLIEAGFRKKVAIYIIIDTAAIQHFLLMCERANMHRGHLNHLRVRCIGGAEFYTRSAQKVRGSLSQKFMFVDGDRAVSGSYSFTWTASRLDRNIVTVLTGQAVETFDKQFRELYLNSRGVNLSKIPMADPPEPDPAPIAVPPPVSVTVVRKLINPKYALVNIDAASKASSDKVSAKNGNSKNPMVQLPKPQREMTEEPQKHPGLVGLPKADLIPYLPTWPEPDPPSDVIGFINIRDTSRPAPVHLMRSQMFETSQAIRFKDPFTAPPEEPLPDKAVLRPKTSQFSKPHPNVQTSTQTQPETDSSNAHQDTPASAPRSPSSPIHQEEPNPNSPSQELQSNPELTEVKQAPEMPMPKPRTIQLVVNRLEGSEDPEITLVRRDQNQTKDANMDARDNDADSTAVTCAHSLKDKDENSTMSDEYYECTDSDSSDKVPNGRLTGSGRVGDHNVGDALNVMARFSQSMLDLRSDDVEQNTAEKNLLNMQNRDKTKLHQMVSRSPGRDTYGRAKVVIAKPGVFHRSPKSSAHVIGGYRYWQGKAYADLPLNGTGQQNLNRSGRSPRRQNPAYPTEGLRTGQTHAQQLIHSQSVSPTHRDFQTKSPSPRRRVETRTPLGISLSKLAGCKHLRGKVPVNVSGFALGDKLLTQRHNKN
ncbi:protein FAM83G [Labeo rohita]|uniref:protein FAM83G n=1 Tax=Labeo rohita TaxID=84645 RepID=UPI0021E281DE|nr:protein FAM83G [Labeo rohita]